MYQSGKEYDHMVSVCFRQHHAVGYSHCGELHGYSPNVKLTFESPTLDKRGWVWDFGGLKAYKQYMDETYDHKTLVAQDDPELDWYREGERRGTMKLCILPATGVEIWSKIIFDWVQDWMKQQRDANANAYLASVRIYEHGSNWGGYINPMLDITQKQAAGSGPGVSGY